MGKIIPRSNQQVRSGLGLNVKNLVGPFTNLASLTAAGYTAAAYPGAVVYLATGGTGSVPCLAISDGASWKQITIGVACI